MVEIEGPARTSEVIMKWLELGAAYFLVALFAIGVFDLGLSLIELMTSGRFTNPNAVIDLIDTVLLLLIIVEVYQTAIAFSRNEPVLRIVVTAALIAIARKVITFRPGEYQTPGDALMTAGSFALLITVLIGGLYVVSRPGVPQLESIGGSDSEQTSTTGDEEASPDTAGRSGSS